jgi:hypothetical protein
MASKFIQPFYFYIVQFIRIVDNTIMKTKRNETYFKKGSDEMDYEYVKIVMTFTELDELAKQHNIELYCDTVKESVNHLNDSITMSLAPFEFDIDVDNESISFNPHTLKLIDSILILANEQYESGVSAFLLDDFHVRDDDDIDSVVGNLSAIIDALSMYDS